MNRIIISNTSKESLDEMIEVLRRLRDDADWNISDDGTVHEGDQCTVQVKKQDGQYVQAVAIKIPGDD